MLKLSFRKKILFTGLIILISLLSIEIFVRIVYSLKYHNTKWLITPFHVSLASQTPKSKDTIFYKTNMTIRWRNQVGGDILYFKFKPGSYTFEANYNGKKHPIQYSINQAGFRNREISTPKNRYRILALGASSTAGLESPDHQTWPAHLEYLLEKQNVEVINMGISSHDLVHVYNLLTHEGVQYKPDMILLYAGHNDIHHNTETLVLDTWYKKFLFKIHGLFKWKIMSYTYLIEKLSVMVHGHPAPFLFYPYEPMKPFLKAFDKLIHFCKKQNIKLVYVTELQNYKGNAPHMLRLMSRMEKNADFVGKRTDLPQRQIIKLFRLQNSLKKQSEKNKDFEVVDNREEFYGIMRSAKHHFFNNENTDPVHLTPAGNRVLADLISKKLKL